MKVTDQELFKMIWQNQMRLLAYEVLTNYIGGRVNVVSDDEHDYQFCSQQARISAGKITDQLGDASVKRRIKQLVEKGWLRTSRKNDFSHTMIDGDEAFEAFQAARQWWIDKGIPTGYGRDENGKQVALCVEKPKDLDSLIAACANDLICHQPAPKRYL